MRYARLFMAGSLLVMGLATVSAQEATTPLGEIPGLNAPRHLTLDAADNVIVAIAGTGGEEAAKITLVEGLVGNTGSAISIASDGTPSELIGGLYSFASPMNEVVGVHKVLVSDSGIWYLMGQGPVEGDAPAIEDTFALILVNGDEKKVIDLYANEVANNPDGGEIDSNPVDFDVAPDGSAIYIADAGANAVLKWTEADGVSTFAAWEPVTGEPQAVPTSVLADVDGNLYVSFLTGFPFPTGGSRIEKYDPEGNLLQTIEGLTMVTDLFWGLDTTTLYAVQFAESFGDMGWTPNSGSVILVGAEGLTPVITGLNLPYSGLEAGGGTFVVSVNTSFLPAGSGALWALNAGDYKAYSESMAAGIGEAMPEPATTEQPGG